jgi:hypothetical protein
MYRTANQLFYVGYSPVFVTILISLLIMFFFNCGSQQFLALFIAVLFKVVSACKWIICNGFLLLVLVPNVVVF